MKKYTRLFEILGSERHSAPTRVALVEKVNMGKISRWESYTVEDVVMMANKVSAALLSLGVGKDDKIALISNNRPEWNFIDLGVQQIGAILVPVYPTISESEYKFIFNDAAVKYCFVSNDALFKKVSSIRGDIPSLMEIYSIEEVEGARNWNSLLKELTEGDKDAIEERKSQVKPDDVVTIIYTSGTTGTPKGVMLTHNNLVSNVKAVSKVLPINLGTKALSFLPLCHSFERMVSYVYQANSITVYYAESVDTLGSDLLEVKPDYFTTVPRLLEKVYDKIMVKGAALTGFRKKIFDWSIALGLHYELDTNLGWFYDLKLSIARKLVFSKWKDALGGNIKVIVTGAAALQPRLGRVFTAAGIPIVEGYGLTETSPVISCNLLEEKDRRLGTIGLPVPGVEVRIAEDGEILARGPNIMPGYYRRQDLTDEVIDPDGWFHTGDIGAFVEDRFLKITDRKKELFKTSGGKYVAPQPIENKYKESEMIEQMMVVGENRKFVSALIVPSYANVSAWCKARHTSNGTNEDMVDNPQVQQMISEEIERLNPEINHVEQVKKFVLVPQEWSVESGELTPTMKVKRRVILERYEQEIEKMYAL